MASIAVWLMIDESNIPPALHAAAARLDSAEREVVLDFSSVRRIDTGGLRAMEELVNAADDKAVKVVLRGVNIGVYKVLKLVKLSPRFSFAAEKLHPATERGGCYAESSTK
jgi:anti-anti-sigma regulatory factor